MRSGDNRKSISAKIMVSYVRSSIGPNIAASAAFGAAIGVLAAVLNARAATEGTEVGEAVTGNVATNAAISWSIASFFCLPPIISRTFRKFDHFVSSLQLVGWPARRYFLMLVTQLVGILVLAVGISYPVADLFQRFVMLIKRRDSDELLYPREYFQLVTWQNLLTAVAVVSFSAIVVCVLVFWKYAFGKYSNSAKSKPVYVGIEKATAVRWIDLIALVAAVFVFIASRSGAQAGLFVIIAMVLCLFWVASRTMLFIVVAMERAFASCSKISAGVSLLGAFSAELHSATKAIILPLCYVLGIPAIVLSVSLTEVQALEQVGQGIQDWDFLIIFGLPLLFVGVLSISSFLMAADQITVTTDRLEKIGVSKTMINISRYFGLPFCYVTLAMALSVACAALSSVLHLFILGSSLKYVLVGMSLKVSLVLGVVLYAAFLVCGAFYLAWGAVSAKSSTASVAG